MLRIVTKTIYFLILITLLVTCRMALGDGCYIMSGAIVGIAGVASVLVSLIPYFIAQSMFRKSQLNPDKARLKVWGMIIYILCFPAMIGVIFINLAMLEEGCRWAFG